MQNQVRLALVGFGLVGRRHAEAIINQPNSSLVAIVEPNNAAREDIIASGAEWFPSLEAMFTDIEVDGVILATPTPLHADQAILCVENSCPVLIEKPITVTSDEALGIVSTAAARNIPVLVGHHRRFNGLVRAAKAAIDEGLLGELRVITANCWLYKPDHYFDEAPWRKLIGAGPISVNLVHDIDLLRHFCGEVVMVQAHATPSLRGYENEDVAAALLKFESGVVATVTVSDSVVAPWSWEMTSNENPVYPSTNESCYLIGGAEGSISIPDMKVWHHQVAPDWWNPIGFKEITAKNTDPLAAQIDHFVRVILSEEQPLVSGLEGMRTLQVIEAIQMAAMEGKTIKIPTIKKSIGAAA